MATTPLRIDTRTRARIWIMILGSTLVLASFATPWWTRGVNIETPDDEANAIVEGMYVHYGPFNTPGSRAGFSTDASRETVTGLLGVLMVASALFVSASFMVRALRASGRIECSADLPVALAITGFALGVAAVLTGILFVPLMGSNPGFMWGTEGSAAARDGLGAAGEFTRYGNAGVFFGILA
ncbi:MAG TPA: hypothetical protein VFH47_00235, partial [Candidatus Thermoplasmatota archaeon]|nr:hypothetical protein [Candidatus Thermoplasmatota archaeon]